MLQIDHRALHGIMSRLKSCNVKADLDSQQVYSCREHVARATAALHKKTFKDNDDNEVRIDQLLGYGANGWVFTTSNPAIIAKVDMKRGKLNSILFSEFQMMKNSGFGSNDLFTDSVEYIDGDGVPTKLFCLFMTRHGITLREWMESHPATTQRVAHLRDQMRKQLDIMHKKNHIHRDVHPGNILLRHGTDMEHPELVLIDFGLVAPIDYQSIQGMKVGTQPYQSINALELREQGPEDDMYAVELILHEYQGGVLPIDSVDGLLRLPIKKPEQGKLEIVEADEDEEEEEPVYTHGYGFGDEVEVQLNNGTWVKGTALAPQSNIEVRVKYGDGTLRDGFPLNRIRKA